MTFRSFIIHCKSRDDTWSMLDHLRKLGYAKSHGSYASWADDYPKHWTIGIHSGGYGLNTRMSVAALRGISSDLDGAIVFNSARHFLASNRNVKLGALAPDSS